MTSSTLFAPSRRLAVSGLAGASLAAAFVGGPAEAETSEGRKLVVVIARGVLDGLLVSVPDGDAHD